VLAGKKHAIERLSALLSYFQELADDPPIAGGCPILNTAIEADDAEPALRDRARGAMDELRSTVRRILSKGIERGEVRPGVDVEAWTSFMISALEGAVMLSRLYQDTVHMRHTVAYIRSNCRRQTPQRCYAYHIIVDFFLKPLTRSVGNAQASHQSRRDLVIVDPAQHQLDGKPVLNF